MRLWVLWAAILTGCSAVQTYQGERRDETRVATIESTTSKYLDVDVQASWAGSSGYRWKKGKTLEVLPGTHVWTIDMSWNGAGPGGTASTWQDALFLTAVGAVVGMTHSMMNVDQSIDVVLPLKPGGEYELEIIWSDGGYAYSLTDAETDEVVSGERFEGGIWSARRVAE